MEAVDHVVLRAGAVGMAVAEALARRGEPVRVVNRSGLREPIAGVQSVAGDVTDPAFAASATRGARVIYQALQAQEAVAHRVWRLILAGLVREDQSIVGRAVE